MNRYRYQQDLSVMDENAILKKSMSTMVFIDAVNISEKVVLDTLEEYGKHFLCMIEKDMFRTKGHEKDLSRMFESGERIGETL